MGCWDHDAEHPAEKEKVVSGDTGVNHRRMDSLGPGKTGPTAGGRGMQRARERVFVQRRRNEGSSRGPWLVAPVFTAKEEASSRTENQMGRILGRSGE